MNQQDIKRALKVSEKWIDKTGIKRDMKYCGIGTANNQLNRPDGSKSELHTFEDRSFAYVLKENSVYAYALFDGYNGETAVDFIEQYILLEIFYEHLNTIETKSDSEIFSIIASELRKTEQQLAKIFGDSIAYRTSLSISIKNDEIKRNTNEYHKHLESIRKLGDEINSGAFATLALLVEDRLFVVNVGTVRCFLYKAESYTSRKVIELSHNHSLTNEDEKFRLQQLKAHIEPNVFMIDEEFIQYTRCLGDFKTKHYYNEIDQFKECIAPPIISDPEHVSESFIITDDCLMIVMCSEALCKAVKIAEKVDENEVNKKIGEMLIHRIIDEATLNSAAQSVVDEIKRKYDDTCSYENIFRDDLTLIVRVFHESPRELFDTLLRAEQYILQNSIEMTNNNEIIEIQESSFDSNESIKNDFDENGHIVPFVDFNDFYDAIKGNESILDEFRIHLEGLDEHEIEESRL